MTIRMAESRDRLRTASRAALIEEADRALASLKVTVCDLERDVRAARILLANGKDPITGTTAHNVRTLVATAAALSDLLAELATPRDGV